MIFKSSGEESNFLTVDMIPNRELFTIQDEAKPYKGKFTRGEEASMTIRRKKDGKDFTFILKTFNINHMVDALGSDSSEWINQEVEITRKFSDKYNKNFLIINPIIPEIDLTKVGGEDAPF